MKLKELVNHYLNENIVVYKGLYGNKKITDNKPVFFVDNKDIAKTYGDNIIKAKLKINNPVVFDFSGKSTYYFLNKWYMPSELANKIKEIYNDIKKQYQLDDEIEQELKYHEYDGLSGDLDGIIMKNIKDANDGVFSSNKPATNYVVFNRNQIKLIK